MLGKFGMTSYGTLARKIKRLDGKDLPVLSNKKNKESKEKGQNEEQKKEDWAEQDEDEDEGQEEKQEE